MAHLSHHLDVSHKYVYFPYNSLENVFVRRGMYDKRERERDGERKQHGTKKKKKQNASHVLCFAMLRWMMILALWSCQHHSHCMHKHMFIFLFRIIYETRRTTTEQSLFHAINKSWPGRAAIHLPNVFTIENSLLAFSFHFAHWK